MKFRSIYAVGEWSRVISGATAAAASNRGSRLSCVAACPAAIGLTLIAGRAAPGRLRLLDLFFRLRDSGMMHRYVAVPTTLLLHAANALQGLPLGAPTRRICDRAYQLGAPTWPDVQGHGLGAYGRLGLGALRTSAGSAWGPPVATVSTRCQVDRNLPQ